MTASFFHGGPRGRRVGECLLPPSVTGAKSLAGYGGEGVCRQDRVYVTTDESVAVLFAAGALDPCVYTCEPCGEVAPDPDCTEPGVSYQCDRARVTGYRNLTARERREALALILSGGRR